MRPAEIQQREDAQADPKSCDTNRNARERVAGFGTESTLPPKAAESARQSPTTTSLNQDQQDQEDRRYNQ